MCSWHEFQYHGIQLVHPGSVVRSKEVVPMSEKKCTEIISEVCSEVCDKLCKYPIIYTPAKVGDIDDDYMSRMFQEKCDHCPLKRLM